MAYEFTKQKLAAERTALVKRLAVTAAARGAGFEIGLGVNDVHNFVDLFSASASASASAIAVVAGVAGFYLVDRRN